MDYLTAWHGAGAYLAGLVVTLMLAAHLTPRRWWQRPTARALLILAAGSWGLGSLLLTLLPASAAPPVTQPALASTAAPAPQPAGSDVDSDVDSDAGSDARAVAGRPFRIHRDLNLRSDASVGAPRLLLLPAGSLVTPTGARRGDWWQVRVNADGEGQVRLGWASSLWLRRTDEGAP